MKVVDPTDPRYPQIEKAMQQKRIDWGKIFDDYNGKNVGDMLEMPDKVNKLFNLNKAFLLRGLKEGVDYTAVQLKEENNRIYVKKVSDKVAYFVRKKRARSNGQEQSVDL